ncbi:hypothetical protein A1D25_02745 [Ursidibacter arcticus]|nr:hypothetical protein A1D25_02745 [Ursidibacter arcticus]
MEYIIKVIVLFLLLALLFFIKRSATFIEIYRFILNPNFKKKTITLQDMSIKVFQLSLVHTSFSFLIILLFTQEVSPQIFSSFILNEELIELIIITPILEEFFFRYPMRKPQFSISHPFFSILLKLKIYPLYVLFFLVYAMSQYFIISTKVKSIRFFIKNFRLYLILSAFIFSILHFESIYEFSFLYFFLHSISALVFSWIRVKFNIFFAISSHSIYNFNLWVIVCLMENLN